jgi:undecaprenyl diphosphate synthase
LSIISSKGVEKMTDFCEKHGLNPQKLPQHVGIVMDGNGRWATARHLPRLAGHKRGAERVREITETCSQLNIEALTLFAFSDENWRRPEDEVSGLMGLLRWYMRQEKKNLLENNVRFRVIGDRQKLSSDIVEMIQSLEGASAHNTGLNLCIALSYGGRGEILRATKRLAAQVEAKQIFLDQIDEDLFDQNLDTHGLPPLDVFIRTGGVFRVSNFLLWQVAYAELFFESCFWPDFKTEKFVEILKNYACRERRFGLTPEQISHKHCTISQIKQGEERGATCVNDTRATSDEVMFKNGKW